MQKFFCKWSFYTKTTKLNNDMIKLIKGFSGSYSLRLKVCILYRAKRWRGKTLVNLEQFAKVLPIQIYIRIASMMNEY